MFYGTLGGLIAGAAIGAASGALGLAGALLATRLGADRTSRRSTFVGVGAAAALGMAWWGRPVWDALATLALFAGLAGITVLSGALIARRSF
ncbi:hypothetical protein [Geodermatophilus sp. FMUSA9-8]|uniref:hypothetical protein n=1 Tax=Geodermatophilus sp. FMUSA9-8 TaxID=3120155 RepID=UPI00300A2E8A